MRRKEDILIGKQKKEKSNWIHVTWNMNGVRDTREKEGGREEWSRIKNICKFCD